MNIRTLYSTLAFAGMLPFLACALLIIAGVESIPAIGQLAEVVNSYGLAIVSFLAGIHWSIYLANQQDPPFNLLIGSNLIFLIAWFAFILGGTAFSLAAQVAAFVALLLIDRSLVHAAIISAHYFRVRLIATLLAVLSLVIIILR